MQTPWIPRLAPMAVSPGTNPSPPLLWPPSFASCAAMSTGDILCPPKNLSAILVTTGEARTLSNLSACLSRSLLGNRLFTLKYQLPNEVIKTHSKAPKVIVLGLLGAEQRFCQQCSRFHTVLEFDDEKRS